MLNLFFWNSAFLLFSLQLLIGFRGAYYACIGNWQKHHRFMNQASFLVIVFLIGYSFKVLLLGKENKSLWNPADFLVFYAHEAFVFIMISAGVGAQIFARRFLGSRPYIKSHTSKLLRRTHTNLGRIALVSASFAWITAGLILFGMFKRFFATL